MVEKSDINDTNVEIAKIAVELVKGLSKNLATPIRRQWAKFESVFELVFEDYLVREFARTSKIKTLISRQKPISIFDAYVDAELAIGANIQVDDDDDSDDEDNSCDEEEFRRNIKKGARLVVTATGGAGKSMLMKHLFCKSVRDDQRFIPVFFELRNLNKNSQVSLKSAIKKHIDGAAKKFTDDHFDFCMRNGKLLLLLDGFDEVKREIQTDVESQIIEINKEYPDIPVVLSSRPDTRFVSWQEYTEYGVRPLSLPKVCELLQKIEYDEETKQQFIKRIKSDLFKSHSSFLSNPLLASMMLLTFTQFSDIPHKEHLFYEQAFLALIDQHDGTKIGFEREFFTGLARDDFTDLFAAFCAFSYFDEKYKFDRHQLLEFVGKAIDYVTVETSASNAIDDFQKTVCLLVQDGDEYVFLHRSFQEYFTARFIIASAPEFARKFMQALSDRRPSADPVLLLVGSMNRDQFERGFLLDRLKLAIQRIDATAGKAPYVRARLFFDFIANANAEDKPKGDNQRYILIRKSSADGASEYIVHELVKKLYTQAPSNPHIHHEGDERITIFAFVMSFVGKRIQTSHAERPYFAKYLDRIEKDIRDTELEVRNRLESRRDILSDVFAGSKKAKKPNSK